MFFYKNEIRDISITWLLVTLAFTIFLATAGYGALGIFHLFFLSLFVAGLGTVFHELGHKIVAQRYNLPALYVANYRMLFLSIAIAIFGFLFVAPGAVQVKGFATKRIHGLISLAGPLVNLILALIFIALWPVLGTIAYFGAILNAWFALFNLIPLTGLDGKKVYNWNKFIFYLVAIFSLALSLVLWFV